MKFNLKNLLAFIEDRQLEEIRSEQDGDDCASYCADMLETIIIRVKSFANELREIRDSGCNLSLDEGHDVIPNIVKEILGEA